MKKRAFTLLELLLVVLIIGLVYGLAVGKMKSFGEKTYDLSLMRLPQYLQEFHERNHVAAVCIDRCNDCSLYVNGAAVKKLEPFVDNSAEYYRFDPVYGARDVTWMPLVDEDGREEEVCFRYDIFEDGSRTEMIVKYRDKAVALPGLFGEAREFASLEDALDAKRAVIEKVSQ